MDLPRDLRDAVDRLLDGLRLAELQQAGALLSTRYRAETRDGRLHLADELLARAYIAARLPATFAAVGASLEAVAEAAPELAPRTQLDVGAGPGTAVFAAAETWASLQAATLIEASAPIRAVGEKLGSEALRLDARWIARDVATDASALPPADLVTLCYVLDELDPAVAAVLVDRLWAAAERLLVVVEPGTSAGWRRILLARDRLIAAGAFILAPCPHHATCPLREPDWCHFARRLSRSRIHRLVKGGDAPFEDEKFIYLAASRTPPEARAARILAPPRARSGKVALKLCEPDGACRERLLTRRDGEAFREARGLGWGDAIGDLPAKR